MHYPDPDDPAQLVQHLVGPLQPLTPHSNGRGNYSQARIRSYFLHHETQTGHNLAAAAGIERVAGSRAHTALATAGLLSWQRMGPRRVFRRTRWGEDGLLAVGRCEVPPQRPAKPEEAG